jgi:hypothetical protein
MRSIRGALKPGPAFTALLAGLGARIVPQGGEDSAKLRCIPKCPGRVRRLPRAESRARATCPALGVWADLHFSTTTSLICMTGAMSV